MKVSITSTSIGAVLVLIGLAFLLWPLALIVAGIALVAFGLWWDSDL